MIAFALCHDSKNHFFHLAFPFYEDINKNTETKEPVKHVPSLHGSFVGYAMSVVWIELANWNQELPHAMHSNKTVYAKLRIARIP